MPKHQISLLSSWGVTSILVTLTGIQLSQLQINSLQHLNTRNFSTLLMIIHFLSMWKPLLDPYLGRSWICYCHNLSTYPNIIGATSNVSGLSNHLAVIFEVNLKPTRSIKPPHKVYFYNKANFDGLRKLMSDSWSAFFASKPEERSVEENWNMFETSLIAGMCHFIP